MVVAQYPATTAEHLPDDGAPRVLRLCSVFEPDAVRLTDDAAAYDPIGGMQNHTAALTRALDRLGAVQTVVTSRLAAPAGRTERGRATLVARVGRRTKRWRQLWALHAVPAILRLPRGRRPDVVHAHQGEDLAVLPLGVLAARRYRCPLVVTVHCSVAHTCTGRSPRARWLRHVGGALERWALRRADAVLVLVPRTAAALLADGVSPERVRVLPSGFEPDLFEPTGLDVLPGVPRPRIGYVGRMAAQKRPEVLVEAFGRMTEEASLVLVGDGPLRDTVRAAVRRSPARQRIVEQGFVPHAEVPSVLGSLDLLVLPSEYEEMGSVLVEAMASGLPVVASRVGGIPDVVVDGETGLLVPPLDPRALARALDELVRDPERRQAMSEAARRRAAEYAWPALGQRVAAVYDAVAPRSAAVR